MTATTGATERDDLGRLRVLPAAAVEALPWEPVDGAPGVTLKVLWRSGDIVIGLVRVEPGHDKPGHLHYSAHHHLWVVSGTCVMLGEPLSPGSYLYIPPGVEHDVTGVGPEGCVYFYTHRPITQR